MSPLQQTPLHAWHVEQRARMVDFAGWKMPVQYRSIVEEHVAVRGGVGLFDISHMGRLTFRGPQRVELLQKVTTNDVAALDVGQAQYSLVTNETGGMLDDILVYRFENYHLVICNASNREKIVSWFERHGAGIDAGIDAGMTDETAAWCMLALQGPRSAELLGPLVDVELSRLRYYRAAVGKMLGQWAIVSRTGYTGEDGFEIMTEAGRALACWEAMMQEGQRFGIAAAGLGARDTLRLEAAMPLYGHELSEEIDPFQAKLGFAVKLDKGPFIGRDALRRAQAAADRPVRAGLTLEGKRIAREGSVVVQGERVVGRVTSGTFSPTLEKSIAMAYVEPALAAVGQKLAVDIRGQQVAAIIVELPFYRRRRN